MEKTPLEYAKEMLAEAEVILTQAKLEYAYAKKFYEKVKKDSNYLATATASSDLSNCRTKKEAALRVLAENGGTLRQRDILKELGNRGVQMTASALGTTLKGLMDDEKADRVGKGLYKALTIRQ